jgi:hypothetical protein
VDVQTIHHLVNRTTLTAPVRRLLASESAEIVDWDAQPIRYASAQAESQGLFRVSGHAQDHNRVLPWNLVLKVIRPPAGTSYAGGRLPPVRPTYDGFWAADPLAYLSTLLEDVSGIRAPRCYGVADAPDGASCCLWLEELTDDVGAVWPLERFGLAARHFGRFNGAYLAGRPLPANWWLSQGRYGPGDTLSRYLFHEPAAVVERAETWDHPLVRHSYPVPVADRLRRLWAEDDVFYAALAKLPRTFCHFDAFRPNLFSQKDRFGSHETVAIDWQHVGIGRVGEELGPLVASTLLWFEVPAELARELGETAFEGYLSGLREAGWTGDAGLARLGYAIYSARLAQIASATSFMVDNARWERARPIWGRPLEELAHQWSQITYYLLDLADEARDLMHLVT